MELANRSALLLLWILPLVVGLRYYADRRRDVGRRSLLGAAMEQTLAPAPVPLRRWLQTGLITLGLAALIFALARPRWGVYYEDIEARGVDLFVLVDTSRSMLAEDVRPNRLELAKSDVRDFVTKVKGDRLGLIAFAGAAVVKCPLTLDTRFFELTLQDLDVTSAPRGGTAIGDAIRVAARAFGTETTQRSRLILLLTDGDDQDSYPLDAAAIAAEQGIQIIAVGLGDTRGTLVPDSEGGFLTHGGEHVRSKLDLATLQRITEITGGAFVPAGLRHHDLGKVYDEKIAPLLGEEATGNKRSRRHERFQWFAALGLLCILGSLLTSAYRPPLAGEPLELGASQGGVTMRIAFLVVGCLLGIALAAEQAVPSEPLSPKDLRALVERALEQMREGNSAAAAELLVEARAGGAENAVVAYDLGCALLAAGNLASADEAFVAAAALREPSLALDVARNRALVAAGRASELAGETPEELQEDDREKLIGHVAAAVSQLRTILKARPADADARHDMAVLKSWLISLRDAWRLADEARAQEEQPEDQEEQPPTSLEILEQLRAAQDPIADAVAAVIAEPSDTSELRVSLATREREEVVPKVEEFRTAFRREVEEAEQAAASAAGTAGQPPQPDAPSELDEMKATVEQAADTIANFAEQAAADLETDQAAVAAQKIEIVSQLSEQLWRGLAPFPATVQRAVEEQQVIVEAKDKASSTDQTSTREITELMIQKAAAMLETLPEDEEHPLLEALGKAGELGPRAVEEQNAAVAQMEIAKWPGAMEAAAKALEYLEEIARSLPQDEQQQQGGEPEDQDQDKEQEQKDQEDGEQNEQDQEKKDQEQDEQEKNDQEAEERPQGELTPEQIQALLQQIREREAERREEERRLRALGRTPVEKDW